MDLKQAEFFKELGATVRKMRISKGLALEDMTDYGFSPQHFQKIESGQKAVNFFTIKRICDAFDLSLTNFSEELENIKIKYVLA